MNPISNVIIRSSARLIVLPLCVIGILLVCIINTDVNHPAFIDSDVSDHIREHDFDSESSLIEIPIQRISTGKGLSYSHRYGLLSTLMRNRVDSVDKNASVIEIGEDKLEDIVVSSVDNILYIVDVTVGNPPVQSKVVADSGSCTLWLTSDTCKTTECLTQKRSISLYNPAVSSTYNSLPQQEHMEIQYGTGDMSGELISDNIKIGHIETKLNFVLAEIEKGDVFDTNKFSGVLGLCNAANSDGAVASTEARPREMSFVYKAYLQKLIPNPIYSMLLHPGLLVFGGVKQKHYTGPLTWVDCDSGTNYFKFPIDELKFGSGNSICGSKGCLGIIDSGTTLMMLSSNINGLVNYHVNRDCSEFNSLPTTTFVIGGNIYDFEGGFLVNKSDGVCEKGIEEFNERIQKALGDNVILIGSIILRRFAVVYDMTEGHPRIGFARAVRPEDL